MITHKKEFGIYHWDTFDNESLLIGETDTLEQGKKFVEEKYKNRIKPTGADQIDIVNSKGDIIESYPVG